MTSHSPVKVDVITEDEALKLVLEKRPTLKNKKNNHSMMNLFKKTSHNVNLVQD